MGSRDRRFASLFRNLPHRGPRPFWEALEPRVLLSAAVELRMNSTVTGQMRNPEAGDMYSFHAAAGQRYQFQTTLGNLEDSDLTLLDRDGETELAYNDDTLIDVSSKLAWKAPADGTYFINVGSLDGDSGRYQISASELPAVAGPISIHEGDTVEGIIAVSDVPHVYTFDAVAGQRYFFHTVYGGDYGINVQLLDQNGTSQPIPIDDGFAPELINWQAPANGHYSISFSADDGDQGDYRFSYSLLPGPDSTDKLSVGTLVNASLNALGDGRIY